MSETAVGPLGGPQPNPIQEARDALDAPSTDVYRNPLEEGSRLGLSARVYGYRYGASIAFGIGNMASPSVPTPHKTIYLDSTLSKDHSGKEKIKAYVWTPDRPSTLSRQASKDSVKSLKQEEKAAEKEERRHRKAQKKDAKSGKVYGDTDSVDVDSSLRPLNSKDSISSTDDEASASNTKRPSTISRISSRLSIRSLNSAKNIASSISLGAEPGVFPSSEPVSNATTPCTSAANINPMDQIPTTLIPQADPRARRPAVINFHGGGFVLGQGTDDTRWAMAVMQALGAVVFSVEYRLAPSYPFPTPVEDCADAILQIWRRADEFWIDRDRIILSGFSAGGTLALASWVLLNDYKRQGYDIEPDPNLATDLAKRPVTDEGKRAEEGGDAAAAPTKNPNIPHPAGLMLFYPLLDWTQSRPRKRLTCSKPELTLPRNLTDIIDASYLYPPVSIKAHLDHPLLSPGLMPDDVLARLPPVQLCLCEYDMLLAEGKRFVARLEGAGKVVGWRLVEGAKHAWDKPLPFSPPSNLGIEYGEAVRVLARWVGGREERNESGGGEEEGLRRGWTALSREDVVPEDEAL